MNKYTVSVIVPTKNSSKFIEKCLLSIVNQSYKNIEIIVVDNFSQDKTVRIAKKYTRKVYQIGPERSSQRNFGVSKATGNWIFFVDSDMELSKTVVENCVKKVKEGKDVIALIIPEESTGEGFWAKCKNLERSFYVGVSFMEAARFFEKKRFIKIGGYDETMVSGEDWYLSQRLEKEGKIKNVSDIIYHNEGKLTLVGTIRKKFYYAKHFVKYMQIRDNKYIKYQTSIIHRYMLFFSKPRKLFANPLVGIGMLVMKTGEFAAGALGYAISLTRVTDQ